MIHVFVYTGLALWLLTSGGNLACRLLMNLIGLKDAMAGSQSPATNVGRYIGTFERLVIALGLLAHSWEAIAAVIALKTIGRFKELDTQLPAEYFLVGSLFSLLWALAVTTIWLGYDHYLGAQVADALVALIGKHSDA